MSKQPNIPTNVYYQAKYNLAIEKAIEETKELCHGYNQLSPNAKIRQKALLSSILGSMGEDVVITPPFWCDYGYNISIGNQFYANHNMVITDGGKVTFGDNVSVAPNCCFATAEYAIDPGQRKQGLEVAKPIEIGNNVSIGAGSTILAGVKIGNNTVIGAGSVVTKSIPANVVAVGVPCEVLRPITEEDKRGYPMHNEAY